MLGHNSDFCALFFTHRSHLPHPPLNLAILRETLVDLCPGSPSVATKHFSQPLIWGVVFLCDL